MENPPIAINLARRLRPQRFSQIVGQDIPVRMLKNSLCLNKFFPVYLFSGQRGCGKTSTARVFAAAVNCDRFFDFQKNPTLHELPCLTCYSCIAMQRSAHPDFIEIDAASNTGVDNVRQIIETASYVPLQGRKKVYLIDEAHMLSKAAFNALLKILEEPPVSVLFMLATTEIHKIPQTVLSRCFQLTFPALEAKAFTAYLQEICRQENIAIDDAALNVLIEETEGSARDALNMLEQVRFIEAPITEISLRKILGKLSSATLLDLLSAAINNSPGDVLAIIATGQLQGTNPQATWDLLINAIKHLLWLKYSLVTLTGEFAAYQDRFVDLAKQCTQNRLIAIMQLLWNQERIFLQTAKKQAFLEFLFLQLAEQDNIASIEELLLQTASAVPTTTQSTHLPAQTMASSKKTLPLANNTQSAIKIPVEVVAENNTPAISTIEVLAIPISTRNPAWDSFLAELRIKCQDSILLAILEQASHEQTSPEELTILLRQNSKFFTDKLDDMRSLWLPALESIFREVKKVQFGQQEVRPQVQKIQPVNSPLNQELPRQQSSQPVAIKQTSTTKNFKPATISASPVLEGEFVVPALPFASLLVTHFPGKLKKLKNFN